MKLPFKRGFLSFSQNVDKELKMVAKQVMAAYKLEFKIEAIGGRFF